MHLGRQSLSVPTWSFACRCLAIFKSGPDANVCKHSSVNLIVSYGLFGSLALFGTRNAAILSNWQLSIKRESFDLNFASRPEMQSLQRASRMPTKINVLMLAFFSSCRLALALAGMLSAQDCNGLHRAGPGKHSEQILNDFAPRLAGSSVKSVEETDEVGISLYNLASWTSLEEECFLTQSGKLVTGSCQCMNSQDELQHCDKNRSSRVR